MYLKFRPWSKNLNIEKKKKKKKGEEEEEERKNEILHFVH
jgi:hypothetical protein